MRASLKPALLLPGSAFILGGETAEDSLRSRAAANESGFSERACRPATRAARSATRSENVPSSFGVTARPVNSSVLLNPDNDFRVYARPLRNCPLCDASTFEIAHFSSRPRDDFASGRP
jgi:hypothetical protein